MFKRSILGTLFLVFLATMGAPLRAAAPWDTGRYALILQDAPMAERTLSRGQAGLDAMSGYRQQIEKAQTNLMRELEGRKVQVTGATQDVLNAVFVRATAEQAQALRDLPGVTAVVLLRRYHRALNRALDLVNVPAAWNELGGKDNAGRGVKIAIIDTGIDQTHPAFQDSALAIPAGFPKCDGANCAFTNNKVIVARSYVNLLAAGSQPNPAADSRPDDLSARDRVGHGTAVAMVAAGETNTGPAATITGVAPKAFLGNYKVFGSPGVNDFTGGDAIIQAIEQAFKDGMDVAVLSLGGPAFSGPLDTGAVCGNTGTNPCDPEAVALENVVKMGMVVVSAGGNEGDIGNVAPTSNTIDSPGYAPDVIAVGAITNSHVFISSVTLTGQDAPANLQHIAAQFGDGPMPPAPVTAPLRDVTQTGDDGLACRALPANSLTGSIALIKRGQCSFATKINNAQAAGAVGAILYLADLTAIFPPGGLTGTQIPALLIGNQDGTALKSFIAAHPLRPVTLDPTPFEQLVSGGGMLVGFSSLGPATGTSAIKPDLVAVGTDLYMATQRFDPNGELYSADGYTVANGTSFSTPMVAGAAALVKQKDPGFSTAQIKSALVNTASLNVQDASGQARVLEVGGGKLDAGAAVATTVTVVPASVSFGALSSTNALPLTQTLTITNSGASGANLTLTAAPRDTDRNGKVSLDRQSLTIGAGQSASVTVTLAGSTPGAGSYEGQINITGGSTPLHVPFLYLVGDGVPTNIIPLTGEGFVGTVNQDIPDGFVSFKVIDQFGLPVAGLPVQFSVRTGGGQIKNADTKTDQFGDAFAEAVDGPTPGTQTFVGTAGGLEVTFDGAARTAPTIASNGVVNGASFAAGQPVAPGSYISIFGSGLSDTTRAANRVPLPLNIDAVNVSFDAPTANLSVPGRVYYVSPTQLNVQVPWELAGQTTALVKVRIADTIGAVYTLKLAPYAPALFTFGNQQAAALDPNGGVITAANPATRGQVVELFANGLGPVTNQPATGDPARSQPLSQIQGTLTVTIGGVPAAVQFSGLAPGFSGLYQVNVTVPASVPAGVQPVVITIGGVSSPAANLNVR